MNNVAEQPIKIYSPSKGQVKKYILIYLFIQIVIIGFVALRVITPDISFIVWGILSILLILRYVLFFNEKDIYTVYLFKDKVVLDYYSIDWYSLGIPFRKRRQADFNDLKKISFIINNFGAALYIGGTYMLSFKMKKAADFHFDTISDKQSETMCKDIQEQMEIYRKENPEIAKKLFEI